MLRLRILLTALAILTASSLVGITSDNIHWKNIGPGSGGNMFTSAVSPADPRIVLMGSDVGGIYRSGDGGQTWSLRNHAIVVPTGRSKYNMQHGSFAFAPSPSNGYDTVYFGSMKSVDEGLTWTETNPPEGIWGRTFVAPNYDPGNPLNQTVYVTIGASIYRTTNGFTSPPYQTLCPGGTGCPTGNVAIRSLVIDPTTPQNLLACVGPSEFPIASAICTGSECGLYRSTDGGQNWTHPPIAVEPGTPVIPEYSQCNNFAFHASSGTLYMTVTGSEQENPPASTWVMQDSWIGGVYRSTNFGASWSIFNGDATAGPDVFLGKGLFEQAGDATHPAAGWLLEDGSVTRVQTANHFGDETWALKTGDGTNAYGVVTSICAQVQGGKTYELSGWANLSGYGSCTVNLSFQGRMDFYSDSSCSLSSPVRFPGEAINYSNTWADYSKSYDSPSRGNWRKFMTVIRPPTSQPVYMKFTLDAGYMPGCAGHTYIDEVRFNQVDSLPKVSGRADGDELVKYDQIVVDPQNVNTVYVGTYGGGVGGFQWADASGVWKSELVGGLIHWNHTTRANYQDNVLDGIQSAPVCGNGICEGRWENCETCPFNGGLGDCEEFGAESCCGNGKKIPTEDGETVDNCRVDVPPYSVTGRSYLPPYDSSERPYYEFESPGYDVHTMAIGKDEPAGLPSWYQGNTVLYIGAAEPYVTVDGGNLWTQVSSDYGAPPAVPQPSWQAHGDATDTNTQPVVTVYGDPNRLYYGDIDNQLQISYDGGIHFAREGQPTWLSFPDGASTSANFPNSIVVDPDNGNIVYCGLSCGDGSYLSPANCAAAVKGVFTPGLGQAVGTWAWSPLGIQNQETDFPKHGSVDLLLTKGDPPNRKFMAAVYSKGIFRLQPDNTWLNLETSATWTDPVPSGKDFYRIVQEGAAGSRLYATVDGLITGQGSIWEGTPDGSTWCNISKSALGNVVLLMVAPNGPNTLLVATSGDEVNGGIYRGQRNATCTCSQLDGCWTWDHVLPLPHVSSVAVSPASSSIVYAFASQINGIAPNTAGIYKSTQGGLAGSWNLLSNDGLMTLASGRLTFNVNNSRILYAGTYGNGVYEGTITCGLPIEGFTDTDLDGTADCSDSDDDQDGDPDVTDCDQLNPAISHNATEGVTALSSCFDQVDNDCDGVVDLDCAAPMDPGADGQQEFVGTITSGSESNLLPTSANNTYEALTEGPSNGQKLHVLWTIPTPTTSWLTGTNAELRVEGFRSGSNESFNFSDSVRGTAGTCVMSEGGTFQNILNVSKTSSDNDQVQIADLGLAGATFCVKVLDSNRMSNDMAPDVLTLDRLFVFPTPVALSDYSAPGDIGTITGSFDLTQRSENSRQILREALFGTNYRLWHTWKFQNVPGGTDHKLHLEGLRTLTLNNKIDDFKFYYSTTNIGWSPSDPTVGFTLITGAVVSNPTDTVLDATFGAGLSGTIYIRVIDAQKPQTGGSQSTLEVDHLAIKTTP